ncbi:MAG TPA: LuxR C-terminal-related transcriptional regulator [Kofleriaceae bacterium]|jgi:DNA-binding NarL/FixJ family response regulator|nr:LuxR C-terminal-related transcriptional regulator [Kofleriaceae bacterium]
MRNLVIWGAPWLRDRLAARGFACDSLRPEAVLVFVADDDDLDAIRRMTAKHAAPLLVVLAGAPSLAVAFRLLRAFELGAAGALLADATDEELGRAIADIAEHRATLDPTIGELLVRGLRARSEKHAAITLTARERDVLRYLVEGHTLAEIADELDIGFYTVQSHVKHIYRKLGVGSKAAATAAALRYQLV